MSVGLFPGGRIRKCSAFQEPIRFAPHLAVLAGPGWNPRGTKQVNSSQTTRGKTLKTLFSSGYLLVCLTTIRVLHLQIPHDSFERPDMSRFRCHALLLEMGASTGPKANILNPKIGGFCRCFSFSKWVVFKFYVFFLRV